MPEAKRITWQTADRAKWDAFVRDAAEGSVCMLSGYMDIAGPGWEAIVVEEKGEWQAVMPFLRKKKWGITYSFQPVFSQFWGVCYRKTGHAEEKDYTRFSRRKELLECLLSALPQPLHLVGWGFSPAHDYLIPFHWAGFTLQLRYSYHLDLSRSEEQLLAGMRGSLRYDIRKGAESGLTCEEESDGSLLMQLIRENLKAGNSPIREDQVQTLEKLCGWLLRNHLGKVAVCRDGAGKPQAAALFTTCNGRMTYLMSTTRSDSSPFSMSLLLWETMRKARPAHHDFDFEGSMIRGIENFFRAFGGRPVPYVFITRNRLPLLLRWTGKLS